MSVLFCLGIFASGFIVGLFIALLGAYRLHKEQEAAFITHVEFWRNRWIDIVRRLDEQDVNSQ